ncbi:hypothetical protein BU17DRAFT_65821 [Hysterangium stoloniferum]|nr:hypothetical protein BU17DRAFT_65821 [Hysterangium stoloniferum]
MGFRGYSEVQNLNLSAIGTDAKCLFWKVDQILKSIYHAAAEAIVDMAEVEEGKSNLFIMIAMSPQNEQRSEITFQNEVSKDLDHGFSPKATSTTAPSRSCPKSNTLAWYSNPDMTGGIEPGRGRELCVRSMLHVRRDCCSATNRKRWIQCPAGVGYLMLEEIEKEAVLINDAMDVDPPDATAAGEEVPLPANAKVADDDVVPSASLSTNVPMLSLPVVPGVPYVIKILRQQYTSPYSNQKL